MDPYTYPPHSHMPYGMPNQLHPPPNTQPGNWEHPQMPHMPPMPPPHPPPMHAVPFPPQMGFPPGHGMGGMGMTPNAQFPGPMSSMMSFQPHASPHFQPPSQFNQSIQQVGDKRGVPHRAEPHAGGKKPRVDNTPPSRVVFLRRLPDKTSEDEILAICQIFGSVVATFLMQFKNQAFVEFETEAGATLFVRQFTESIPLVIRNQTVLVQFSNRQSVTKSGDSASLRTEPGGQASEVAHRVLLVTLQNAVQSIPMAYSADQLYALFGLHGPVEKIVKFVKGDCKALIQFQTVQAAASAKQALSGQHLTDGTHLHVGFSHMPEVTLKAHSELSKDFTQTSAKQAAPLVIVHGGVGESMAHKDPMMMMGSMGSMGSMGNMGNMGMTAPPPPGFAPPMPSHIPPAAYFPRPGGNVLLINGITESVTATDLFTLCGLYGDVLRVKILFTKRDSALVQFANEHHSRTALEFLNGMRFRGATLVIQESNKTEVVVSRPAEGQPDDPDRSRLNMDFSSSTLHRFVAPNSRAYQNISPPVNVVHVSNIPLSVTEDDLKSLFGSGVQVSSVQFITPEGKLRKMAIATVESVEAAAEGIVQIDGMVIEDSILRANFAHARRNGSGNIGNRPQ